MELWSGGAYKATLYRTVFPDPTEGEGTLADRYTFAYVVQPDEDVVRPPLSQWLESTIEMSTKESRPVLNGGKVDITVKAISAGELFRSKPRESMERSDRLNMPPAAVRMESVRSVLA